MLDEIQRRAFAYFAHETNPHSGLVIDTTVAGAPCSITASNGPGSITREIAGIPRRFVDYFARGVADGPDDGTIAPWAVAASLPFAPEIVIPTLERM